MNADNRNEAMSMAMRTTKSADEYYKAVTGEMCKDIPEGMYAVCYTMGGIGREVFVCIRNGRIVRPLDTYPLRPALGYSVAGVLLAVCNGAKPTIDGGTVDYVLGEGCEYVGETENGKVCQRMKKYYEGRMRDMNAESEREAEIGERRAMDGKTGQKTKNRKAGTMTGRKIAPNGVPYADYTGCTIVRCKNPNVKRLPDGGFAEIFDGDSRERTADCAENGLKFCCGDLAYGDCGRSAGGPKDSPKDSPEGFDSVDRPRHYTEGRKYEPIDVAEDWGLDGDAYLFNALKYISRAGRKGDAEEDLRKARFYLDRRIRRMGCSKRRSGE